MVQFRFPKCLHSWTRGCARVGRRWRSCAPFNLPWSEIWGYKVAAVPLCPFLFCLLLFSRLSEPTACFFLKSGRQPDLPDLPPFAPFHNYHHGKQQLVTLRWHAERPAAAGRGRELDSAYQLCEPPIRCAVRTYLGLLRLRGCWVGFFFFEQPADVVRERKGI